ncbi:hypothetical protein [uncultured Limnobacter sp.]|uniref:hypothetical protein n=1 Tax=uncultured Limnobacter sp. TaxID=199681 RepID=UPI0030F7CC35
MKFQPLFVLPLLAMALPAHAETAAPQLEYQSAFEAYQPYNDPEIKNWPNANQLVDEIGGWRVYAREPYEKTENSKPTESQEPAKHQQGHQHGGAK